MFSKMFAALLAVSLGLPAYAQEFSLSDAADELLFLSDEKPVETVEIRIAGNLSEISFVTDENGLAIYQGDIVLGDAETIWELSEATDLSLQSLEDSGTELFGLVARWQSARWPGGRVPFFVDSSVPSQWRPAIRQAIRHWETETDIRFDELEVPGGKYILFFDDPLTNSCQSPIGRSTSGPVRIQLATWCKWGNVAHEIGHALGLHHEQARKDRDRFVEVTFSDQATDTTKLQFRSDPANFADAGPYCYDSIMHYPVTNQDASFTIRPLDNPLGEWTGNKNRMGQRNGLADCDTATISAIYGFAGDEVSPDGPATGFEGDLALFPVGCESTRKCYLMSDLRFTDLYGLAWLASKRDPAAGSEIMTGFTDGASIPEWAQPIVGNPFDPSYIKAATIHDHYMYNENRVRRWWATQRVFYDMLQNLGVPQAKAQIMYLAVLIGSAKWLSLVPGENCGDNCVNDIVGASDSVRRVDNQAIREWDDIYGTAEFDDALKRGVAELQRYGDQMTLGDVNALAAFLMPDHPVFLQGDQYRPRGSDDPIVAD